MFKTRKSLDNGLVHVVFETQKNTEHMRCIGVFSSLREAKCAVITTAFRSIDKNHYNPINRFTRYKDTFSLSKVAPSFWNDAWKMQGVNEYSIQSWCVDTHKSDTIYCTLDNHIKSHIAINGLSWTKTQELLESWCSLANYEQFYISCFAASKVVWSDETVAEQWVLKYDQAEYMDTMMPKVLTRHMSMLKRV